MEKEYKNYIFDLYATLIDIHTNQNMQSLWKRTASILEAYGASYTPSELRKTYRALIHKHETVLSRERHTRYVEIDIGEVFRELLLSPPNSHTNGIWGNPEVWSGELLERWCASFAYTFRVLSRVKFALYPDTIEVLDRLKQGGKHIYLLSNAQNLFTRPELDELGLTAYFEDIFISSEHGIKKPEPLFMKQFLDANGLCASESVMIGNELLTDVVMAAGCGVDAILVNHDGYSEEEIREGFEKARSIIPSGKESEIELKSFSTLSSI